MFRVPLPRIGFQPVWRTAARRLASHRVAPEQVVWDRGGDGDLFAGDAPPDHDGPADIRVPGDFPSLAHAVLCHSDADAPGLAYRALVRHQTDRAALTNPADPLTRRLARLEKSVRRDIHKMHAFVRFRELDGIGNCRRFGAWFEPDHHIIEAGTPFFARRFADMDWMIATPQGVARFEHGRLDFGEAAPAPDLPDDACEALWATYFTNIFNPARVHIHAMTSHMPRKYWKNLPETQLIPGMLAEADARVERMRAALPTTAPLRAARILGRMNADDGTP